MTIYKSQIIPNNQFPKSETVTVFNILKLEFIRPCRYARLNDKVGQGRVCLL